MSSSMHSTYADHASTRGETPYADGKDEGILGDFFMC